MTDTSRKNVLLNPGRTGEDLVGTPRRRRDSLPAPEQIGTGVAALDYLLGSHGPPLYHFVMAFTHSEFKLRHEDDITSH